MGNDLKNYLGTTVDVIIDRALGTNHPKHGFIYELNYGYIPNTINADGEEIDAYVLGVNKPIETYKGKVIAIIHRFNDNDDKLVVTAGEDYTDDEIIKLINFQEKYFKSEIIRK